MKRIIIDYKKLDHHLAALLIDLYPHGYGDDDIITLKKPNGDIIEAVEIKTDDTIYLVIISNSLYNFIATFEENIEKNFNAINKEDYTENNSEINYEAETDNDLDISKDVL